MVAEDPIVKTIIILNSTVVVLGALWFLIPYLKDKRRHRAAAVGFAIIFALNFYFMLNDYTPFHSLLRALGFTSTVYVLCRVAIYFERLSEKK